MSAEEECYYDDLDAVKAAFPEIVQVDTAGVLATYVRNRSVRVAVIVEKRTPKEREREIQNAIKKCRIPRNCKWSTRDDGQVWVFFGPNGFTNG